MQCARNPTANQSVGLDGKMQKLQPTVNDQLVTTFSVRKAIGKRRMMKINLMAIAPTVSMPCISMLVVIGLNLQPTGSN